MADPQTTEGPQTTATPPTVVFPDRMDGEDPDAVDIDQKALADAEAEVAAEEGGTPPAGTEPPVTPAVATPAAPAAPATEPPAQTPPVDPASDPGDQAMVPHAKFHAVNEKLKEATTLLAYREGQLNATQAPQPAAPAAEPPPPAPDFAKSTQDARDKFLEETRRFDAGEITATDLEESRFRMGAEVESINTAAAEYEQQQQAAQQPAAMTTDQSVKAFTEAVSVQAHLNARGLQLQQEHPYLRAVTPADMEILKLAVVRESEATATPIILDESPQMTMRLREAIAQKIDAVGPILYPNFDPKQGQPTPQPGAPTPGGQPALSTTAQQRLDKLTLEANHPPDTSTVGSQGGHVEITDQQIEAMSDDEIAALPDAIQQKFLQ